MQIRYTRGPDDLQFGEHRLVREQWRDVPDDLAAELLARGDAADYGFEAEPPDPLARPRKKTDQSTEAA